MRTTNTGRHETHAGRNGMHPGREGGPPDRDRAAPEPDRAATEPTRSNERSLRRWAFPFLGLVALAWFFIRVIPKPSRATYPCQRAAFPLASAFVLWVVGVLGSTALGVQAREKWRQSRPALAVSLTAFAVLVFILTVALQSPPGTAAINGVGSTLLSPSLPALAFVPTGDSLTATPSAVVGTAKSTQDLAEDITFGEITSMVNQAIELAGGFDGLVADGDTVILKPNLIFSEDYSEAREPLNPEVNGIATDHRVIQATVDAVRAVNPNGAVFLMEGSGVGTTPENMSVLLWDQVTGLDGLIYLEEACGDWFDTTSVYLEGVSLPEGKALYGGADNRYWLNKLYLEADAVISLPVLKNHFNTGVTGAVKNVGIGATPPTIYGRGPNYPNPYERWTKINHGIPNTTRVQLHFWIHDFYMCRPVDFVVTDGLQGIQNGPLCLGSQHISDDQKNARMILAGRDAIAVDAIASLLCGHDAVLVRHLVELHNDSLGCVDPRLIRVEGVKVGDEKQDYDIWDSGTRSKYTDFTPPSFTVESCDVRGDQLHLGLTVDAEVNKVEVTVDGVWLSQIRLGEFEDFSLDLGGVEVNPGSEIVVYAYDRYLNHASRMTALGTGVESWSDPETRLRISPTPSRSLTTIRYALPRPGKVTLSVYDVGGRKVRTLIESDHAAGRHEVVWNSSGMSSGVYLIRLDTDEGTFLGKVVKVN